LSDYGVEPAYFDKFWRIIVNSNAWLSNEDISEGSRLVKEKVSKNNWDGNHTQSNWHEISKANRRRQTPENIVPSISWALDFITYTQSE
jgi:hypothetical protein